MRRALVRLAVVTLVATGACGCFLLPGYPEPTDEASASACANGVDDDLDGARDCADDRCLPFCPEDCANGADDDRDERIDCFDSDCRALCPEDCTNGVDENADGRIDCADTDCDGHCPEATGADNPRIEFRPCVDGRDNDGDGRVDLDDVRCWPGAAPTAALCTGTPAIDVEERFDDGLAGVESRWTAAFASRSVTLAAAGWDGPGTVAARGGRRDPFAILDASTSGVVTLLHQRTFTSIETIEAAISVDTGTRLVVALVPAWALDALHGADEVRATATFGFEVDGRVGTVEAWRDGTAAIHALAPGIWYRIEVGDSLRVVSEGGEAVVETPLGSGTARPGTGLRWLVLSESAAGGVAAVDDLRLRSPYRAPCGRVSPELPRDAATDACLALAAATMPIDAGHEIAVVDPGGGAPTCALASEAAPNVAPGRVRAWTATSAGSWEAHAAMEGLAGEVVAGVGAAWTSDRIRAVVAWRAPSGRTNLQTYESDDCVTFTATARLDLGSVVGVRQLAYVVRELATGPVHELWWSTDDGDLLRAISGDGTAFEAPRPAGFSPVASSLRVPLVFDVAVVGASDLVLVAARDERGAGAGVDVFVATNDEATAWRDGTILQPLLRIDDIERVGDITSLALLPTRSSSESHLFVGTHASSGLDGDGAPGPLRVAVASAAVTVPREPLDPPGSARTLGALGCAAGCDEESCDRCSMTCGVCAGTDLAGELLSRGARPRVAALATGSTARGHELLAATAYSVGPTRVVHAVPDASIWVSWPLDVSDLGTGEWELRADVRLTSPACEVLLGIGSGDEAPAEGDFVRVGPSAACGESTLRAHAIRGDGDRTGAVDCGAGAVVAAGLRHRVRLASSGSALEVAMLDVHQCEIGAPRVLRLDGLVPARADTLFLGVPPDVSGACPGGVLIENVVLRRPGCETRCGAECVTLGSHPEHCGDCAISCGVRQTCSGGVCGCGAGWVDCDGECVDLAFDAGHCGRCDEACASGEHCIEALCSAGGDETCSGAPAWPVGGGRWLELDGAAGDADTSFYFGAGARVRDRAVRWTASNSGVVTFRAFDAARGSDLLLAAYAGMGCAASALLGFAPVALAPIEPPSSNTAAQPAAELTLPVAAGDVLTLVVAVRDEVGSIVRIEVVEP